MKPCLLALLPLFLIAGCASSPPTRAPGWWTTEVQEQRPEAQDDKGMFYGSGSSDRAMQLGPNDALEIKWKRTINGAPTWVMHLRPDRTGYVISYETWADGSVIRAAQRKLDFTLTAAEADKLRQAISDSGVLSLRSRYGGGSEVYWALDVRAGKDLFNCDLEGGYPNEAKLAVQAAWDLIVKPRAEEIGRAGIFDPQDWQNAPEFARLR